MMNNFSGIWLCNFLAALILSPLCFGIIAKVKAFFAGRKGIPLLQLYFDIFKLMRRGAIYSTSTGWVFKLAPAVIAGAMLCAFALLPCSEHASVFGFDGDIILFIYFLALARAFTVLAALDTASSFEGMGSARELHFSIFSECAVITMLAMLCIHASGEISFSGVFQSLGEANRNSGFHEMAMFIGAAGFFLVLLAENCRVPVDDPETHLELTMIHEAMILDYSGPDLGLLHYSCALKLWCFCQLLIMMIIPALPLWGVWLGVLAAVFAVGIVESVMPRFRLLKVPHLLTGAFALELAALALLIWEVM